MNSANGFSTSEPTETAARYSLPVDTMTHGQDDYIFKRDYLDNNRINLQHYLWREIFGYLLHPAIPTGNPHLKIADVGTGTGAWLTDLTHQLPETVQLDGLDISFDALPPRRWLPANVNSIPWNIETDVPQELEGVYDIVHIRLFAFVLLNEELPAILVKLVKLLKPGGHLQWDEPDIASFRIEKADPGISTDALSRLLKSAQGQDARFKPTWVSELPALFRKAGLLCVQYDVREAKPWVALAMHECNLMVHEVIESKAKDKAFTQELPELLSMVANETRQGAAWAFTRYAVVGTKVRDA